MVGAEGQKFLNFKHPKMAFLREKLGILSLVATKIGGKNHISVLKRGAPLMEKKHGARGHGPFTLPPKIATAPLPKK